MHNPRSWLDKYFIWVNHILPITEYSNPLVKRQWRIVDKSFDSLLCNSGQKTLHPWIPYSHPQGIFEPQVSVLGPRLVIVTLWGNRCFWKSVASVLKMYALFLLNLNLFSCMLLLLKHAMLPPATISSSYAGTSKKVIQSLTHFLIKTDRTFKSSL